MYSLEFTSKLTAPPQCALFLTNWRTAGLCIVTCELWACMPPPWSIAWLLEIREFLLISSVLCRRWIAPSFVLVARLFVTFVSLCITIVLSVTIIASPFLAWLFKKLVTPIKWIADLKACYCPTFMCQYDIRINLVEDSVQFL